MIWRVASKQRSAAAPYTLNDSYATYRHEWSISTSSVIKFLPVIEKATALLLPLSSSLINHI